MIDARQAAQIYGPLSKVEGDLCVQLNDAQASHNPSITVSGQGAGSLRADFLRWFLLSALPQAESVVTKVSVSESLIGGRLDLEGAKLGVLCEFTGCGFPDGVLLDDCEVVGLAFVACDMKTLCANRLTASGSFVCRGAPEKQTDKQTQSARLAKIGSSVDLCGASIRGNLDFRACRIDGRAGDDDDVDDKLAILADGMRVEGSVLLGENFYAGGEIRLNGCEIVRNLDCSGGSFENVDGYSLSAAGARIHGTVYLCPSWDASIWPEVIPFRSCGEFRLAGAQIDGDVDCTCASFIASCFSRPQSGDQSERAVAFNLDGAEIGADLRCAGDSDEKELPSVFSVFGQVSMVKAKIGGDLICDHARLELPGGDCLTADGIIVGKSTYLGENLYTNGFLRFAQGTFEGGLYADGIEFDCSSPRKISLKNDHADETGSGVCGIYAPCATVKETFIWRSINKIPGTVPNAQAWLFLESASADEIDDEQASWRTIDRFNVSRCSYQSLAALTGDIEERLDQLDRQYAILNPRWHAVSTAGQSAGAAWRSISLPCRAFFRALFWSGSSLDLATKRTDGRPTLDEAIHRFAPQPYLQLAKVVRAAGFEAAATKVLVRLEYNITMYGDHRAARFLGNELLNLLLRFGYAPFRPLRFLIVWFFVSLAVFEFAYQHHEIRPTPDNQVSTTAICPHSKLCPAPVSVPKVGFNAFVYTMETLVPLVDFGERKNWTVEPLSDQEQAVPPTGLTAALVRGVIQFPDYLAGLFLFCNAFLGWALWSFTAAAVTGLLRRSGDS